MTSSGCVALITFWLTHNHQEACSTQRNFQWCPTCPKAAPCTQSDQRYTSSTAMSLPFHHLPAITSRSEPPSQLCLHHIVSHSKALSVGQKQMIKRKVAQATIQCPPPFAHLSLLLWLHRRATTKSGWTNSGGQAISLGPTGLAKQLNSSLILSRLS